MNQFKKTIVLLLLLLGNYYTSIAQNEIVWNPDYRISLSDFQSPLNSFSNNFIRFQPSTRIDFSYQMSNYEFMFTKNFNNKVVCKFLKDLAYFQVPDSGMIEQFVTLAQYDFDLGELYARKLRKKLFEGKKLFSDASFFQPYYNEIDKEKSVEFSNAVSVTNMGKDKKMLAELHAKVLAEIDELQDFCKDCKPSRKKK